MAGKYYIKFAVWLPLTIILAIAGCGKDEVQPNAQITFFPNVEELQMSPGEQLELLVVLKPVGKLKELFVEKNVGGVKTPIATISTITDTLAYNFAEVIDPAPDSSTIFYTFRATTTDDKVTYRTVKVTVANLEVHEAVQIGAEANTSMGHYYSASQNKVYAPADSAKNHSRHIDFVYYNRSGLSDSLAAGNATIAAPSSPYAGLVYPHDSVNTEGLTSWNPRNTTNFKRASPADFDLEGVYAITQAYNAIEDEGASRVDNLNTTDNSTFFFLTAANKIGVAKVREVITSPSAPEGYIILDVKVRR